jgi:hypothetical protein
MVVVGMSSIPLRVIRRETCLWTKGPLKLSKNPRPKRCPNVWKREDSKEITEFMKVEEIGVQRNKHDGYCAKQWIIIPKVTWTLPNLRRRSTCWTSFSMVFFMKVDMNDEVLNGTPKI